MRIKLKYNMYLSQFLFQKEKWTKLLLITGIVTTFGSSLPVGYNIGVINAPAYVNMNEFITKCNLYYIHEFCCYST